MDKLQELTDKLYNEGLAKGKEEGARILEDAKKKAEEIIANATKDLAAAETKYDEINKSLLAKTGAKATKTTELNESYHAKLDPLQNRKVAIETEISGLNREIIKLESIKDVCPTCGHKLEGVTKPSTAEQHAKIKALTEELATLTPQITACNSKYAEYVTTINKNEGMKIISEENVLLYSILD